MWCSVSVGDTLCCSLLPEGKGGHLIARVHARPAGVVRHMYVCKCMCTCSVQVQCASACARTCVCACGVHVKVRVHTHHAVGSVPWTISCQNVELVTCEIIIRYELFMDRIMGIRDYDRDSICKLCVAANALMRGSIETLFHNFNALNEGKLRQETALSYWCIVRNCELTLIENIHLHL